MGCFMSCVMFRDAGLKPLDDPPKADLNFFVIGMRVPI